MGTAAEKLTHADLETNLVQEDHEALRLWLRLFTCTTLVERVVDSALKKDFASSLPRFDLLSQLHRAPDGLRMGELSRARALLGEWRGGNHEEASESEVAGPPNASTA